MDKLGAYNRVSEIQETNNAFLFDVQAPDATTYFAKVPKNLEAGSSAARQFNLVSRHLKKIKSEFINKVIDAGTDEDTGTYFMILEKVVKAVQAPHSQLSFYLGIHDKIINKKEVKPLMERVPHHQLIELDSGHSKLMEVVSGFLKEKNQPV